MYCRHQLLAGEIGDLLQQRGDAVRSAMQQWQLGSQWSRIEQDWQALARDWQQLPAAENLQRHNALAAQLLVISRSVAEESQLTLDSAPASYWIQNLLFERLLPVTEHLGQARAFGVGIAMRREVTVSERVMLGGRVAVLEDAMSAIPCRPDRHLSRQSGSGGHFAGQQRQSAGAYRASKRCDFE